MKASRALALTVSAGVALALCVCTAERAGAAFPSGWQYRVAITITNSMIDAPLTNWTVVFDQDFDSVLASVNGPLDADGTRPSLNGGGDIRFSSDSAGSTRLACDIRTWVTHNTPANATCEVAVKVPLVSSSTETTCYMWWGKSGETQPSASGTYGRYNAYGVDYENVWPLNEDPSGSAPQMLDRTSNQENGTSAGSMTSGDSVAGVVGNALDFDGINDYINSSYAPVIASGQSFSVSLWGKTSSIDSGDINAMFGGVADANNPLDPLLFLQFDGLNVGDGKVRFFVRDDGNDFVASHTSSTYDDGNWHHFLGTFDGSAGTTAIYIDGALIDTDTSATSTGIKTFTGYPFYIGARNNRTTTDKFFDGQIDGVRVYGTSLSAAWIKADYNNQNNTSGFLTWGTIESVSTEVTAGIRLRFR